VSHDEVRMLDHSKTPRDTFTNGVMAGHGRADRWWVMGVRENPVWGEQSDDALNVFGFEPLENLVQPM